MTDDRQTDGPSMTYSEYELEFTFAKNESTSLCRLLESFTAGDERFTSNSRQWWAAGCTREGRSNEGLKLLNSGRIGL